MFRYFFVAFFSFTAFVCFCFVEKVTKQLREEDVLRQRRKEEKKRRNEEKKSSQQQHQNECDDQNTSTESMTSTKGMFI